MQDEVPDQKRNEEFEFIEIRNVDWGGRGLHESAPPVSEFIEAAFRQLKDGKADIAFGFSEAPLQAGPAERRKAFEHMNPVNG